ncbi:MAG: hypothetical protein ACYCW6_30450, partial [Candidatus Xenobia bacterium]
MIFLLLLLLLLCPAAWADDPWRLPADVVPKAYHVEMAPDVAAKRFAGAETVEVQVRKATGRIVLNALELEIPSATVDGKPAGVKLDPKRERVELTAPEVLQPGAHRVALRFNGRLHEAAQCM